MRTAILFAALAVVVTACTAEADEAGLAEPAGATTVATTSVSSATTTAATSTTTTTVPTTTTTTPTSTAATAAATRPVEITASRNVAVPGGLPVDVFHPTEPGPWPVAVVVHGGGWISGEKEDIEDLARAIARRGVVVFNADYRPLDRGGVFPDMIAEVACATSFARKAAAAYGGTDRLTVVGFSAGAHVASVAALAPEEFSDDCPAGSEPGPDGFVGISGPFDSDQFPFLALQFGGLRTEVPAAWAAGNPYTYLGRNLGMEVLLLHGENDIVVDPEFSLDFAKALDAAGYASERVTYPDVGHFTIVDVEVNGATTVEAVVAHLQGIEGD